MFKTPFLLIVAGTLFCTGCLTRALSHRISKIENKASDSFLAELEPTKKLERSEEKYGTEIEFFTADYLGFRESEGFKYYLIVSTDALAPQGQRYLSLYLPVKRTEPNPRTLPNPMILEEKPFEISDQTSPVTILLNSDLSTMEKAGFSTEEASSGQEERIISYLYDFRTIGKRTKKWDKIESLPWKGYPEYLWLNRNADGEITVQYRPDSNPVLVSYEVKPLKIRRVQRKTFLPNLMRVTRRIPYFVTFSLDVSLSGIYQAINVYLKLYGFQ